MRFLPAYADRELIPISSRRYGRHIVSMCADVGIRRVIAAPVSAKASVKYQIASAR